MEGIAGTYGAEDRPLVKRMLRKLRHRGPETSRTVVHDRAVLGACAPATGGRRFAPIAQRDGVSVASDSCLFNREWLSRTFTEDDSGSRSDSEIILDLYRQMGVRAFDYLDGAFAIAIVDGRRTVLARDRYGLKPLYLSGGPRKGVYSSEIKSQLLTEEEFVPFPKGKCMVMGKGYYPIRQKRSIDDLSARAKGQAKNLRNLLVDSVRKAGEGNTSFNILLSGGVDSSAVAAAASLVSSDLKTVCVGAEGGKDIGMARAVAKAIGSDHEELDYDIDDMLEILDDVTYASESFDFPLIRSCIPNYMASHAFGDKDRMTLCGEGGDEIFAGYDYMREIRGEDALRKERMKLLRTGDATGFQRVDRMNASASLDGRMPLMAKPVIDFGLSIGRRGLLGPKIEQSKLVLRKAFEDILPSKVMRRRKQRFSDGAGSIHSLVSISEDIITDAEFERERRRLPKNRIRTKEELLYYRSFAKHFDSESAIKAVGFTPRP